MIICHILNAHGNVIEFQRLLECKRENRKMTNGMMEDNRWHILQGKIFLFGFSLKFNEIALRTQRNYSLNSLIKRCNTSLLYFIYVVHVFVKYIECRLSTDANAVTFSLFCVFCHFLWKICAPLGFSLIVILLTYWKNHVNYLPCTKFRKVHRQKFDIISNYTKFHTEN